MCMWWGGAGGGRRESTKGQDGDLSSRSQNTAVKEPTDDQMQRKPKTGLQDLGDKGKPLCQLPAQGEQLAVMAERLTGGDVPAQVSQGPMWAGRS